jgi:ComF family protein
MILNTLKEFSAGFFDLLYPRTCPSCGTVLSEPGISICQSCRASFAKLSSPFCTRCGAPVLRSNTEGCDECIEGKTYYNAHRSLFSFYDDKVRECLHTLKFSFQSHLAADLGEMLSEAFANLCKTKNIDAIVPVPLHRSRLRSREFNQSTLLAKALSRDTGISIREDLLKKAKRTKPQSSLNLEERKKNPVGVFKLTGAESVAGMRLAVIDDIYTTGTTVNQAAYTLKEGGARYILALTVARAVEPFILANGTRSMSNDLS